jgi:hypothetical protein
MRKNSKTIKIANLALINQILATAYFCEKGFFLTDGRLRSKLIQAAVGDSQVLRLCGEEDIENRFFSFWLRFRRARKM